MTKVMDEILSRWFLDKQFRDQLRNDPAQALAGYDLTPEQQARLFRLKKRALLGKRGTAVSPPAYPPIKPSSQN